MKTLRLALITLGLVCLTMSAKAQLTWNSWPDVDGFPFTSNLEAHEQYEIPFTWVDNNGFPKVSLTNLTQHPRFASGVNALIDAAKTGIYLNSSNTAQALVSANAASVSTTSFVSGQRYTNTSGVLIEASTRVSTTTALVAGGASIEMRVYDGAGSLVITPDWHGVGTALLSLSPTTSASLRGKVPAGYSGSFTNTSTGAGNSATTISSSGQITFLP